MNQVPPNPWSELKFDKKYAKVNSKVDSSDLDILKSVLETDTMIWEKVTLPSLGIYYRDAIPGGVVEIRPMGLDTDKILSTQRYARSGRSLEYVYKKCVKFPTEFDPLDLLVGDRTFIFYYLRGITHGNNYDFIVKCTNKECGVSSTHTFDMNNLASKIQRGKPELGEEPFKVELPYLTKCVGKPFWVKIRLTRGHDTQKAIAQIGIHDRVKKEKEVFNDKDPVGLDNSISENLNDVILEVMGDRSPETIRKFVEKLHSNDISKIREFIENASPGIDSKIELNCDKCGNTMHTELPITEHFFRPQEHLELG